MVTYLRSHRSISACKQDPAIVLGESYDHTGCVINIREHETRYCRRPSWKAARFMLENMNIYMHIYMLCICIYIYIQHILGTNGTIEGNIYIPFNSPFCSKYSLLSNSIDVVLTQSYQQHSWSNIYIYIYKIVCSYISKNTWTQVYQKSPVHHNKLTDLHRLIKTDLRIGETLCTSASGTLMVTLPGSFNTGRG